MEEDATTNINSPLPSHTSVHGGGGGGEEAVSSSRELSELEFCTSTMRILCGIDPVPSNPSEKILDRSVHPEYSTRDVALTYLTDIVKSMKFTVPVSIDNQVWVKDEYIVMGNLLVTVEGTEVKDEVIIMGAHYDVQNSLSSCWRGSTDRYLVTQGADDNTSGTVACLAILRRFTKEPPKRTTIVVLFDGEEPGEYNGMTIGSKFFVKSLTDNPKNYKYVSAVIADMVGGPPTTPHGFVIALSEQVDEVVLKEMTGRDVAIETAVTVVPKGSTMNCLNLSDSANFPKLGIPTVLVSNLAGFHTVPTFYHTEDDTIDVINWTTFMQSIDLLHYLVSHPLPPKQRHGFVADQTSLRQLLQMGFSTFDARTALEQANNNLEIAIVLLTSD